MSRIDGDRPRVNTPLEGLIRTILTDQPIAYHPILARALNSVTAALFLSQLLYWTPRAHDPEGWVRKEQWEIQDETGLTRREQETARKVLKAAGILDETRRGVPGKMHFRVDMEQLVTLLSGASASPKHSSGEEPAHNGGKRHSTMAESAIVQRPKAPLYNGGKRQRITETTTETTTESISSNSSSTPNSQEKNTERKTASGRGTLIPSDTVPSGVIGGKQGGEAALSPDDYAALSSYLASPQHAFGDRAKKSSLTRLLNLYTASEVDRDGFLALMGEAESVTKDSLRQAQRSGTIIQRPMAFWFTVLESLMPIKTSLPELGDFKAAAMQLIGVSHEPDVERNPDSLWTKTLREIQSGMTEANYSAWFSRTTVVAEAPDRLEISVPSSFHKHWLEERLASHLRQALTRLGKEHVQVDYTVAPPSA